jgi:hypothetical protein
MNELFHAVSIRLKVIFTAHATLELESELILLHAERKAALLKRASQLEEEGLDDLASELRTHVGDMDLCKEESKPALAGPIHSGRSADEVQAKSEPDTAPPTARKKSR